MQLLKKNVIIVAVESNACMGIHPQLLAINKQKKQAISFIVTVFQTVHQTLIVVDRPETDVFVTT